MAKAWQYIPASFGLLVLIALAGTWSFAGVPKTAALPQELQAFFFIDDGRQAMVAQGSLIATSPDKLVAVQSKEKAERSFVSYRIIGDELRLCSGKDGQRPRGFTAAKGTGQSILVLKREQSH